MHSATNLLNAVQSSTGTTLTVNNLLSLLSGGGFSSFKASALCTDCGKAIFTFLAAGRAI